MNASVATNKFKSVLGDILNGTTIKLGKVLVKFIYNCVIAIVSIKGRVNFLQLKRHSNLNEKTFRNNYSKNVDWFGINEGIALRELPEAPHRVIDVDPAHINKADKCTPSAVSSAARSQSMRARLTYAARKQFLKAVQIDGAKSAWTGIVFSNGLKRDVRIVIVEWQKTGTAVFFSTDTKMDAAKIVAIYRSRFQIEFGIRDSRQFAGLHHSQARAESRLGFAFNISFFTRNVLQTEIDRYFPQNSVGQLKNAIADTEFVLRTLEYALPNSINDKIMNKIDHMIASYVGAVA